MRFRPVLALALAGAALLGACGDDDDDGTADAADAAASTSETTVDAAADTTADTVVEETTTTAEATTTTEAPTTTTEAPEILRILVTNDDGIGAPGITALADALAELPDVEVTVVAPAENQSGTSDSTTPTTPTAVPAQTASGREGHAVPGFPADSVNAAFDQVLPELPHVVVSGTNEGQNIGPFVDLSGTVGAARTAARRGVPALAVSQGLGEPPAFAESVELAVAWVEEHREELLAHTPGDPVDTIDNINAPTCTAGEVRGLVEVTTATDFGAQDPFGPVDCTVTTEGATTDVEGFFTGYAVIATLGLQAAA
jgi:5'-nucleotidase